MSWPNVIQTKEKRVRLSVSLPAKIVALLKEESEQRSLPISYIVQIALEEYFGLAKGHGNG